MKPARILLACIMSAAVAALVASCSTSAKDPLNATYIIEGQKVRLRNGRSEVPSAPGSATNIVTSVSGNPVQGDLNDDGQDDETLILIHDPGGSGTFYYVAVALNRDGAYRGTNAVLLGDRVTPRLVTVRNGVITAGYADRRPEESKATPPSVDMTMYLVIENDTLSSIGPLGAGEMVTGGWITIDPAARSFLPCKQEEPLWLTDDSPALTEISAAYSGVVRPPEPYAPVFMVLAGAHAEKPADGPGARYDGAFRAMRLVRVWPQGDCD